MSLKSVVTIAAIALAVTVAHDHVKANGLPGAGKARIGN